MAWAANGIVTLNILIDRATDERISLRHAFGWLASGQKPRLVSVEVHDRFSEGRIVPILT